MDLHQGSILCLDLDDRYVVSGSKDRTVVQTDRWRREKVRTLGGHQDSVLNVVLDGEWIYSASKDRTIMVWSSVTGDLHRTLHGHREAVNAIKVHQDRIVSASGDRTIKLWNRVRKRGTHKEHSLTFYVLVGHWRMFKNFSRA
jgi:WD40 repeat protein